MAWFNLGKVLDKKGWSLYRFSKEIGVAPNIVTTYFRPGYEPRGGTLLMWCEKLGCTLDELVDDRLDSSDRRMPRPKTAESRFKKE